MKVLKIAVALLLFSGLASAAPCTLGVTVQPDAMVFGQPVSISYSAPYLGFILAPSFAIDGSQITIDQPTVHADPLALGDIPCGQRVVQVGVLSPGFYNVTVNLSTSVPISGSFVIAAPTVSICGVSSSSLTGPDTGKAAVSVTLDQSSALLRFQNEGFADYVGSGASRAPLVGAPLARVDGYKINVTQSYLPGPVSAGVNPLFCQNEEVALGHLPVGSYEVVWTYLTPDGPVAVSSSFNLGTSPRGRSVRH